MSYRIGPEDLVSGRVLCDRYDRILRPFFILKKFDKKYCAIDTIKSSGLSSFLRSLIKRNRERTGRAEARIQVTFYQTSKE
jgi:hypothetical protein